MSQNPRMKTTSDWTQPWLPGLERGLFVLLIGWLFAAAALVELEYYDGYDSILNADYFIGETEGYQATRGPLMGLLLVPAQAYKRSAHLHPLDVRPHHFTLAILHSLYLLAVYLVIVRVCGRSLASLMAFLFAVPVFLFFTYAPFISHDILPGIFLLGMVVLADRFMDRPGKGAWMGLVLLGGGAALIKHTYALFWVFVVLGPVAVAVLEGVRDSKGRKIFRATLMLLGAAVASGVLCVVVLGFALKGAMPDLGFFERVGEQIEYLSGEAHDKSQISPLWVYLRNLPAFGIAAMVLILPGLVMSWRENRTLRACVIVWVLGVIAMHVISIRQVRYLAFLLPITALLIATPIRVLLKQPFALPGLLALWATNLFTAWSPVGEAGHAFSDFYRHSPARAFLEPVDTDGLLRTPIILNWGLLSFMHERDAPLVADIYHDTFHLGTHHLFNLYDCEKGDLIQLSNDEIPHLENWPDGAVMMGTSAGPLLNPVSWKRVPARNKDVLEQFIFLSKSITVAPEQVTVRSTNKGDVAVVQLPVLADLGPRVLIPRWVSAEYPSSHPVEMVGDDIWVLHGVKQLPLLQPVRLRYFRRVD